MKSARQFPAAAMAFLLAATPAPGRPDALGVIVEAHLEHLNSSEVSAGTTVYDKDQFSTEKGGTLRLRSGAAMLELAERSHIILGSQAIAAKETEATLIAGTVVFSAARAKAMEIQAQGALIRPVGDTPTVGQVSVTGAKELRVYARRSDLLFSYGGETEIITQGKAYRVVLGPPDDDAKKEYPTKKPTRRRKAFILIAVGVGAAVIPPFIHELIESPDRP